MSETSIQVAAPPPPRPSGPPPQTRRDWLRPVKKVLQALASLRLTVFLFVLSMFLVFTGTLAMRDNGLWMTLSSYFRCFIAWIPLQVFVPFGQVFFGLPRTLHIPGSFPFPGGWLLGGALLVNLLAAHALRFTILKRAKDSAVLLAARQTTSVPLRLLLRVVHFVLFRIAWKRSGIVLIHSGIIVLMLGELVTGKFAVETRMPIVTGEYADYAMHIDRVELAFLQDDPRDPGKDHVVVVPDALLRKSGTIEDQRLPFTVEVVRFLGNTSSQLRPRGPDDDTPATRGDGVEVTVDEMPSSTGTDSEQEAEKPAAYVTLRDKKTAASLGTYLVWVLGVEQEIGAGGDAWRMALRYQRSYQPYKLYLEEFHHDFYPGTGIPKNFSSRVRVLSNDGESREVVISMNSPLRYKGETFYQASWLPNDSGTSLQVVRNPGAYLPYISCFLVCLGMLIHFGLHLSSFLERRAAA
ncbi:MAG TPA: cytochrome c biogenesis protein ResB [Gemmataceae bacterium]|nr:cytochrome c biogenesis protein ResB [Gemmataceae bacterium]